MACGPPGGGAIETCRRLQPQRCRRKVTTNRPPDRAWSAFTRSSVVRRNASSMRGLHTSCYLGSLNRHPFCLHCCHDMKRQPRFAAASPFLLLFLVADDVLVECSSLKLRGQLGFEFSRQVPVTIDRRLASISEVEIVVSILGSPVMFRTEMIGSSICSSSANDSPRASISSSVPSFRAAFNFGPYF